MNLDKFIKSKDYVHTCPMCNIELSVSDNEQYKLKGQTGYSCPQCMIPGAQTMSGAPYSRFIRAVMKDMDLGDGRFFEQIIVSETFYIHVVDNDWYIVHNDLIKGQTAMVLAEPTTAEHVKMWKDEKPTGLMWKSQHVILPFVDSWDLSDQPATLNKIKTYLTFL